jgi:hypothetical protein
VVASVHGINLFLQVCCTGKVHQLLREQHAAATTMFRYTFQTEGATAAAATTMVKRAAQSSEQQPKLNYNSTSCSLLDSVRCTCTSMPAAMCHCATNSVTHIKQSCLHAHEHQSDIMQQPTGP